MVETTENCCFSNAETPSAMRQKRLFREKAGNQIAGGSKTKLHSGLKLRAAEWILLGIPIRVLRK